MALVHVAADVLRDAAKHRLTWWMGLALTVLLFLFGYAFDLGFVRSVLDSPERLAGFRVAVGASVRPVVLSLGMIATAGIVPRLLVPGRIDALLALPVPRWQIMVGTFVGMTGLTAIIGVWVSTAWIALVGWKIGVWVWPAWWAAAAALAAYVPVGAVMMLTATVVRSSAMSIGMATVFLLLIQIADARADIVEWVETPWLASVIDGALWALPPLGKLGGWMEVFAGGQATLSELLRSTAYTVGFGLLTLAAATLIVRQKDC